MTSPDLAVVRIEILEHVMTLTLNRPDVLNAVDLALTEQLGEALEAAEADPAVRAVIVTGAGDRAFCAGADLGAISRGEDIHSARQPHQQWGFAGYVAHAISKPTIAAVNGFALGGGTEIALASDLIVAVEDATFGLPEVKRGIIAGAGGAFRLTQQLPPKLAMEMLLTGEPITAQRAFELGLVNRVVRREVLLAEAMNLARRITANAPLAVQATKRVAHGIEARRVAGDAQHWEHSLRESTALLGTADAVEGVRAFTEKRLPRWTAR